VNHLEATKTVVGSTVTSAAGTATLTIDTLGYDYASVDVVVAVGAVEAATSPILKALSLYQYDNTATTAAVYTVTAPAANDAVTNQPSVVRFDVDLRGKQRYLVVDATPETTLPTTIVARLGKGEKGPESAADKGVLAKYSG
jgi:hypothetical protein